MTNASDPKPAPYKVVVFHETGSISTHEQYTSAKAATEWMLWAARGYRVELLCNFEPGKGPYGKPQ